MHHQQAYGCNLRTNTLINGIHFSLTAYLTSAMTTVKSSLWIGLKNHRYKFYWMDQTAMTYTNWAVGEPKTFRSIFMVSLMTKSTYKYPLTILWHWSLNDNYYVLQVRRGQLDSWELNFHLLFIIGCANFVLLSFSIKNESTTEVKVYRTVNNERYDWHCKTNNWNNEWCDTSEIWVSIILALILYMS